MSKDEIVNMIKEMKEDINKLQRYNPTLMDNTHLMAMWDNLAFLESDIERIYKQKEQENKY